MCIRDRYCDDVNNNMACNFDDGDCCGDNVNTQYCSVCECIDGESTGGPTVTVTVPTGSTDPSGIMKIETNN